MISDPHQVHGVCGVNEVVVEVLVKLLWKVISVTVVLDRARSSVPANIDSLVVVNCIWLRASLEAEESPTGVLWRRVSVLAVPPVVSVLSDVCWSE